MSSPSLDDNSFSVDFSSELLAAFDFGGFELIGGSLFSFGSYENEYDDASFSFSVESYVGVRTRTRRSRKKRLPNRQFRKMLTWFSVDILAILANKTAKHILTRWVCQPPIVIYFRLNREWITVINTSHVLRITAFFCGE